MTPDVDILLRLVGVSLGYDGRPVVSGVDLEVHAGDYLGIVGPNGAGKTTLFRGALGLVAPLSGRIERGTTAIGYVPQRESLDPIFPVRAGEVVHMGAYGRLRGLRGLAREDRQLARECLRRVGLESREREPFASLSGGQRQRVLIGRALMVRPRLLLLDEPTSGVDREAQAQIFELLSALNREEGLTILLVSHHQDLVRESVKHVLLVGGGSVRRGTPGEMLRPEVVRGAGPGAGA